MKDKTSNYEKTLIGAFNFQACLDLCEDERLRLRGGGGGVLRDPGDLVHLVRRPLQQEAALDQPREGGAACRGTLGF